MEIRDITAGSVRVLPGMLGQPILLSDQVMIEAHFVRNTQYGAPYMPTGHFVLDLVTNKETPLPGILWVMDTWPH